MGLFNANTGRHSLQSLTLDGALAAVYPSEDQLWLHGPTITDPQDQGVAAPDGIVGESGGAGAWGGPSQYLPVPQSEQQLENTEAWLHEVMNGQVSNGAYGEEWVNLTIGGPAGFGNWNEQPYYTGHSQIVQSNPGAEQGWGVGPARRWAHYPFSQCDNPARNAQNHLRMGALPWAYSEQNMLYYRSQLIWEQQWAPYKQRNPVTPVVGLPASVPYVQTIPAYAGGDIQYAGLDVPILDHGAGIY